MLLTLLFQAQGLLFISLMLIGLVVAYSCPLVVTEHSVTLSSFAVFSLSLHSVLLFLVARLLVALTHFHNFHRLLLSILDFFPCLRENKTVCMLAGNPKPPKQAMHDTSQPRVSLCLNGNRIIKL